MRRRRHATAIAVLVSLGSGAALADGCSATSDRVPTTSSSTTGQGAGSAGGAGGGSTTGGSPGQGGDIITVPDGGDDAPDDVVINPCGTKCGPIELCDEEHLGLDDNCDGQVDEGCSCSAGQAHFCFKGDPSFRGTLGCFDGTELCTEQGVWGPCIGGVHAIAPDDCFNNDTSSCHPITSPPYAETHLETGTGSFSANAVPGSESYTVACPSGVSQCPSVTAPDAYTALQSGEYTVTYTKTVAGDPTPKQCTFPLFVGAPGLRVELSWEHTTADDGVDLDLHVHQPGTTQPWAISPGQPQDCTWSNCVFSDFDPPQSSQAPNWFAGPPAMPPTPVDWWLDTTSVENNTCYNDPRGIGAKWKNLGLGCHNPRLDADNITCTFATTNPNDATFCTPENINVDFPPTGVWTRIAVHYYNNHNHTYDVHPTVKVFCNGALAANLGPSGYYSPETPVTFEAADGAGSGGNRFWVVGDVLFQDSMCGGSLCTVQPVYSDPVAKTPFFMFDVAATQTFAPDYPPVP